MKKTRKRLLYEQRIYKVQDYISIHLDEELSLEKLAKISAFSPFYFHRIFKSIAGETLYDFIQRLRLEKACSLLAQESDLRIIDIALECGFSTASAFAKAFKQRFKITPSEWKSSDDFNRSKSGKLNSKNGTHNSKISKEKISPVEYTESNNLEHLYYRRKEMNVKIEDMPKYRIAYMRQIGPYGPANFQLMENLKKWASARDLLTDLSILLGIAHDDPEITPPENCRYDTCIVLPDNYKLEDSVNVNEKILPGGKYAVYRINHTPEEIAKAWTDLFSAWLPDSGYQIDERIHFERYFADHENKGIVSEICISVKPL